MENRPTSQPSAQLNPNILLGALKAGKAGIVRQLKGDPEFLNRIVPLGFTLGAQVMVTHNYGSGPLVVSIRGAQVALGRREANQIVVQML